MYSALSRVAYQQLTRIDPLVAELVGMISRDRTVELPPRPALVRWTRMTIICLVRSVEHEHLTDEHRGLAMALVSRNVAGEAIATWVHLIAVRTWKSLLTFAGGHERDALLERADRFFSTSQRIQTAIVRHGREPRCDEEPPGTAGEEIAGWKAVAGGRNYAVIVYPRTATRGGPATIPCVPQRVAALTRQLYRTRQEIVEILPMSAADTSDVGPEALNHARDAFRSAHPDVLAGLAVAETTDEVPSAFASAREVLHTVHALCYRPGLYQVSDVTLETLVCRSPDIAGHLAARVYPVVDAGDYLVETVDAFLAHGTERKRLARRLYIHPNTLNYRLKRIHELTGLSLTAPHDLSILRGGMISLRLLGHLREPADTAPIRARDDLGDRDNLRY